MQLRDLLVLGLQAEQHPRTLGLVLFLHGTDQRVRRCGGGGVCRSGGAIVRRSCCGGPLWWNRSCGPIGRKWCRGRPLSGRWTHLWHRTRLIARRSLVHFPLATVASAARTGCIERGCYEWIQLQRTNSARTSRNVASHSRIALVATVRGNDGCAHEIPPLAPLRAGGGASAPRAFRRTWCLTPSTDC